MQKVHRIDSGIGAICLWQRISGPVSCLEICAKSLCEYIFDDVVSVGYTPFSCHLKVQGIEIIWCMWSDIMIKSESTTKAEKGCLKNILCEKRVSSSREKKDGIT